MYMYITLESPKRERFSQLRVIICTFILQCIEGFLISWIWDFVECPYSVVHIMIHTFGVPLLVI